MRIFLKSTISRVMILSLLLSIGCIEPFKFRGVDADNDLVIDGYITNVAKRHYITVTRTQGFSNFANIKVSGCSVSILHGGEVEHLVEVDNGIYSTNPFFKAEEGVNYSLEVITPTDERIISKPVKLVDGETMVSLDYSPRTTKTVRFRDGELVDSYFVDFSVELPILGDQKYYKWNFTPFYIFRANLARDTPREWCYVRDYEPRCVALFADDNRYTKGTNKVIPIGSIPYSFKLEHEYRLMVEQLVIDEEAFKFWESVRRQAQNVGSVFDPLPSTPKGNLESVSNPEDNILGYFGAYQSDSLIIRFNHLDLEELDPLVEFDCGGFQPRPGCFDCRSLARGRYKQYGLPEWW